MKSGDILKLHRERLLVDGGVQEGMRCWETGTHH